MGWWGLRLRLCCGKRGDEWGKGSYVLLFILRLEQAFVLMMVFIFAWFTDIIGVHSIFGAFIFGVIMPRENGFAVNILQSGVGGVVGR